MKILIQLLFIFTYVLHADNYPNKPIDIVVAFGKGGSTDRMSRAMQTFLENELDTKINIINKRGRGTLVATNYVMKQKHDGYTVLASTFAPYLPHIVLQYDVPYDLEDFELINLQWFEFDMIAVHKNSKVNTLVELINEIKKHPRKLSVAVMNNSTADIIVRLLLEKFQIPKENLEFVFFSGGRKARNELKFGKVDFIVISAQGSELYRDYFKPLALVHTERTNRWDAPIMNDALQDTGIQIPILKGSMRGFAVSKKFKQDFPKRYKKLVAAFKRVLAKREVHRYLKKNRIGYNWVGPAQSNRLLKESYESFQFYDYLLKD